MLDRLKLTKKILKKKHKKFIHNVKRYEKKLPVLLVLFYIAWQWYIIIISDCKLYYIVYYYIRSGLYFHTCGYVMDAVMKNK